MEKETFERKRKGLRLRNTYIQDLAASKNCQVYWDNMRSHYILTIENKLTGFKDEEVILTKGVKRVKRVNEFYDIFETKLGLV